MTYRAGSAAVSVTPDMSGFHKAVAAELDGLDAQFAKAGDSAGMSFADAFKARTSGLSTTVKADADTAPAEAKLDALTKKPRSVTVKVKEVADKVSSKTGTLKDLANPVGLSALGAVTLGPQALGLAAGVAGLGVSFGAAAADAGAFGIVAKGMFSDVTTAQTALTKAQQAYNTATTSSGRAKALADEQKALAGLTPAEKDLAVQLTSLQGAWGKLDKAEQPVVERALAPWLQDAEQALPLITPLISGASNAIELLGNEAGVALKDPIWKTFFSDLGTTGEIGLQSFGEAAGHVVDALANLFVTFAPDIDKLPPLVDKLAGSFDDWSKSVTSKGLDDFLSKTFSPDNVKQLADDGKNLATFVENVAKASQDMSPLAFGGISNVLTVLGSVPPGVIEAATGLFLAIKTIGTISSGVSAVTGLIGSIKGLAGKAGSLLGLGGQEAAAETEGATIGATEGGAAATAFTTSFQAGATAGLAESAVTIGAEGEGEAATVGATWGGSAAGAFGTALTGVDSLGLAAAFVTIGAEGTAEAAGAGTVWGGAAATAFGVAVAAEASGELAGAVAVGAGALIAAGAAGAALGGALGLGFKFAFGLTGAKDVVTVLAADIKNSAASANTWLLAAGAATVQGYVSGFVGQQAGAIALGAKLKGWVQAGAAGSNTWLTPHGQQAGTGFDSGFEGARGQINGKINQLKSWVTGALPDPLSWLVGTGINVGQGFLNGIIDMSGPIISAAEGIASSVMSTINNALQVRSPSRLTFQTGAFTGQGLALGLDSTQAAVRQSGLQLASASVQGLAGIAAGQSLAALGVPSISSPSLPGVGSPLRGGSLQLQVSYAGTGNALTDAVVGALRFDIQQQAGGDAQAHLGQGPVRI